MSHYNLSTVKQYAGNDPHREALEQMLRDDRCLPTMSRVYLFFALGKAWADIGMYDKAFTAYQEANHLMRSIICYEENTFRSYVEDVIRHFNRPLAGKASGHKDATPVFIIGMPRSGTTLVEQILSSHSAVYGAGERRYLSEAISMVTGLPEDSPRYLDWLIEADKCDIARIGEYYITKLRALDGLDSKILRITDKMPANFCYAGLIHMALPQAKIIHVVRDPLDICISNYLQLFQERMPFSYDLGELGRYYTLYEGLMRLWKAVLPRGSILDVRYEDLVTDLEGQAKRLIEYCGLSWESGCLDFHKNGRLIKTASSIQVRQPLYRTSIGHWKHYEKFLAPLLENIRDALEA